MNTPNEETLAELRRVGSEWRSLGLRLPPIPNELVGDIEVPDEGLALRSADVEPSDRDAFTAAAADLATKPYVSFGYGGYGTNNRALFYQLVAGPIAVFARLPFGNVYGDPAEERAAAAAAIDRIEELVVAVEEAARRDRLPAGARLVVTHDPIAGSTLGLVPGKTRDNPDALADALSAFSSDGDDE